MKRIRLGESQPAWTVITGTGFLFGVALLFITARLARRPDAWRFQLLGAAGLIAAVRLGVLLARRFSSAYVLVYPNAIRVHQHGPLWPGASFPRNVIQSASEVRISDADPLWSLRLSFVDNSERTFGSFRNPAIHEALQQLNAAISGDAA
jgi:hypothetical protein